MILVISVFYSNYCDGVCGDITTYVDLKGSLIEEFGVTNTQEVNGH